MSTNNSNMSQLRVVQTLNTVALIAAPISLLLGSLFLSVGAFVCACIGRVKLRAIINAKPQGINPYMLDALTKQSIVACIIGIVAISFNAVIFAMAFGTIMDAISSGNYADMYERLGLDGNMFNNQTNTEIPENTSIWD